jgi:hypothetical protein
VLAAKWAGPVEVAMEDIDFSKRSTWRASHEDISSYVEKLHDALSGDKRRKPSVFVKTPKNPLVQIVDGHHRTLSSETVGVPALAYVADVYVENGPWESLHAKQTPGSSREEAAVNPSFIYEEEGVTHDDEAAE